VTIAREPVDQLRRSPSHPDAIIGCGAADLLADVIEAHRCRRVLVVHGQRSFHSTGISAVIDGLANSYQLCHFDQVRPNPTAAHLRRAIDIIRRFGPDTVIAVGGGSVLDVAKAGTFLAAQRHGPLDCLLNPELIDATRECRLVLLPTTSGSGSEATRFATIYHDGRKYSVDHDGMRADTALVDPQLTGTVPMPHAVASGLDALCHAVESFWSVTATQESRGLAMDAIRSLAPALQHACRQRSFADSGGRSALAWGAHLAGAAIDHTRTTAAHALSYALTARYALPHGAAVALHLRWLLRHTTQVTAEDCLHPGGIAVVRRLVAEVEAAVLDSSGTDLCSLIDQLLTLGGFPSRLADLGRRSLRQLTSGPPDWIDEAIESQRSANHPQLITRADVLSAFAREEQ
jgi:alcohol dehydrogenase